MIPVLSFSSFVFSIIIIIIADYNGNKVTPETLWPTNQSRRDNMESFSLKNGGI